MTLSALEEGFHPRSLSLCQRRTGRGGSTPGWRGPKVQKHHSASKPNCRSRTGESSVHSGVRRPVHRRLPEVMFRG